MDWINYLLFLHNIEVVLGNCVRFKGFGCTHTEFTALIHTRLNAQMHIHSNHHEVPTCKTLEQGIHLSNKVTVYVVQLKDLTQTVQHRPFSPISDRYDLRSTYLDMEVLHQMDDIRIDMKRCSINVS